MLMVLTAIEIAMRMQRDGKDAPKMLEVLEKQDRMIQPIASQD